MIVTGIRQVTKRKLEVELDGEPAFMLYSGDLSRYHIQEGQELSEEVYRELAGEVLVKRARLQALRLLTKRDYTEQELRLRLSRAGYPEQASEDALEYVKAYRYVNDESYAKRYVEHYKDSRSGLQLRQELARRGVPREIIQKTLEEAERPEERQLIRQLAEKKLAGRKDLSEKEFRRLYGFFARKGFQSGDIAAVLQELDIFDKIEMN